MVWDFIRQQIKTEFAFMMGNAFPFKTRIVKFRNHIQAVEKVIPKY